MQKGSGGFIKECKKFRKSRYSNYSNKGMGPCRCQGGLWMAQLSIGPGDLWMAHIL